MVNLMEIRKLKNGKCIVDVGIVDGKRKRKSFQWVAKVADFGKILAVYGKSFAIFYSLKSLIFKGLIGNP